METGKFILLVDDDQQTRKLLLSYLGQAGFQVWAVDSASEFRRALEETGADLVIIDVVLPDESGLKLCHWIHKHPRFSKLPIILLTGRTDEANKVLGLELGADDYLCKPFSLRELHARINALLRRTSPEHKGSGGNVYMFGDWCLNTVSRRLSNFDGEEVVLAGSDFSLLKLFVEHPQEVLDRNIISNAIRGRDLMPTERVDTAIYRLRKRLRDTSKPPKLILSVRGGGYVLAVDVVTQSVTLN